MSYFDYNDREKIFITKCKDCGVKFTFNEFSNLKIETHVKDKFGIRSLAKTSSFDVCSTLEYDFPEVLANDFYDNSFKNLYEKLNKSKYSNDYDIYYDEEVEESIFTCPICGNEVFDSRTLTQEYWIGYLPEKIEIPSHLHPFDMINENCKNMSYYDKKDDVVLIIHFADLSKLKF